jgi:hypothetical protein
LIHDNCFHRDHRRRQLFDLQYPKQWDLTEDKQNTLAKETLETLTKITDRLMP